MNEAAMFERMRRSMEVYWRLLAAASRGGQVIESGGVLAAVFPAAPDRSVFNSVIYSDFRALATSLEALAGAYDHAGVRAWTVWVPEADRKTARLLERAGHHLDAAPRAMAMELRDLPELEPGDLEWSSEGKLADLAAINDVAYGYQPGTFARGIGDLDDERIHQYEARLDGTPASVLMTLDDEEDCSVWFVATLPDARGRGLAGRLLHVALEEGRARGRTVSTLQATKPGRPVYERLGYRDLGALEMWERRSA